MIICVRFCGRRPTASAPPRTSAARRVATPTRRAGGHVRGAASREWRRRRAPTTWPGRRPTASAPPRTGAARRLSGRGRRLHRGSGRGWSSWRDVGRGTSSRARPSAGEAIARPPRGAARRLAGRDAVIESLREAGPHWRAAGRRPSSWPRPSAGGAGTIESSVSISRVAILLGSATTCSTRVSSATDSSYAVTRRSYA